MEEQKEYLPLLHIETVLHILHKISILGGLSDRQLYSVFKLLQEVSYRAGEYIFRKDEEPSHIYIVRSGEVKIIIGPEESPLTLSAFGEGQCFGETAAIGIQPHSASALVSKDSELIVLSRDALLSIFDSDKELFGLLILNIAREACRRLHKSDEVLLHYIASK